MQASLLKIKSPPSNNAVFKVAKLPLTTAKVIVTFSRPTDLGSGPRYVRERREHAEQVE